jgi:hypothetical protein
LWPRVADRPGWLYHHVIPVMKCSQTGLPSRVAQPTTTVSGTIFHHPAALKNGYLLGRSGHPSASKHIRSSIWFRPPKEYLLCKAVSRETWSLSKARSKEALNISTMSILYGSVISSHTHKLYAKE